MADDKFPSAPPNGFKSSTFDWRACEAVARVYAKQGHDETDLACIRLGMPIDGEQHNVMLATTLALAAFKPCGH